AAAAEAEGAGARQASAARRLPVPLRHLAAGGPGQVRGDAGREELQDPVRQTSGPCHDLRQGRGYQ
ncbi:MAG: hypothetical protein AVDCRST_MAG01-01-2953, partial [uncultured Rubrobacteraceae bacterium]